MCYDISFSVKAEKVSDYFPNLKIEPQFSFSFEPKMHVMAPLYAKAPQVKYPVIIFDQGEYRVENFEWDLIPSYANTPEKILKGRGRFCNAQSERIIKDKKSVWYQYRGQRCLIPVTGIFEHREVATIKGKKIPYLVKLKDREIFGIPGLYNYSPIPDMETGEAKGTFTLITCPANSVMRAIHNSGDHPFRMPLFLPKELEQGWLMSGLSDDQIQEFLDFEMPSDQLDYSPVYTIRGTKPRPDGKEKTEPFEWPNLPELIIDEIDSPKLS